MRGLQLADHRLFVTVCDGYYAAEHEPAGPGDVADPERGGQRGGIAGPGQCPREALGKDLPSRVSGHR